MIAASLGGHKKIVSTFSYLGYTLTIFKKPYSMCEFALYLYILSPPVILKFVNMYPR